MEVLRAVPARRRFELPAIAKLMSRFIKTFFFFPHLYLWKPTCFATGCFDSGQYQSKWYDQILQETSSIWKVFPMVGLYENALLLTAQGN